MKSRFREMNFMEVIGASPKPKSAQDLVIEADELIRNCYRYSDDPENLSKTILELAIKNAGIGNHLADAEALEADAKAHWRYKIEKRKLELVDEGKSATVAESKAELEHFEEGQEYRQLKKAVTLLKLKRDDINRIFEGGRSRLSVIKADLRQVEV